VENAFDLKKNIIQLILKESLTILNLQNER